MKRNELKRVVNHYLSKHRRSGQGVNIYYPLTDFPDVDLLSFRKVLNALCYDAHCKLIYEHRAIVIYTLTLGPDIATVQREPFAV